MLIDLPWYIFLITGLTVWIIYSIDHLVDARSLSDKSGPLRYTVHRDNYKLIVWLVLFATGLSLGLAVWLLPEPVITGGFVLAGIVAAYFLLRLLAPSVFGGLKELVAAIVYTAGIALPACFYMEYGSIYFLTAGAQFFCLVLANLLTCGLWDEITDRINSYPSMAITLGTAFIKKIIISLIFISMATAIVGIFLYSAYYFKIQLIILLMNAVLVIAFYTGHRMEVHIQRLLIDSMFFIPLLLLIL